MSERVTMQPARPDPQLVRLEAIINKQQLRLGQLETSLCVSHADFDNAAQHVKNLEEQNAALTERVKALELPPLPVETPTANA